MTEVTPIASVIIPTYGRPEAIADCLDALTRQTMPFGTYEVIIIDDGSPSPLTLKAESRYCNMRLIRQENAGPAAARNRGAAGANGEILVFTDDDCLPDPDWLEKLVAVVKAQPNTLAGGSTRNGLVRNAYAATSQLILDMVYSHFNSDKNNAGFFTSNNMACRRLHFIELGGFDEAYEFASEDRDICDRWRLKLWPLVWEKNARIEHRHALTLIRFIKQHVAYGRGAYKYREARKARASGSMAHDLRLHWLIPGYLLRDWSHSRKATHGLKTILLLAVWQVANLVGFLMASVEGFRAKRRRSSFGGVS